MPLTECLAIAGSIVTGTASACMSISNSSSGLVCDASNTTSPDVDDLGQCMATWLGRSKTVFHGMHEELVLPWWFGMFCLNYSVGGLFMFILRPKWTKRSNYPYTFFALFLVFVQGPLSFQADYVNMTNDSLWHVADRFVALFLLVLEFAKAFTMFPHTRRGIFILYCFFLVVSILSFLMSQKSQKRLDAGGFVFWHTSWHMYPLYCSIIMSYDKYILGEYDPLATTGYNKTNDTKPPLLSTIVMNDPKFQNHKRPGTRKTRKEA